MSDSNQTLTDYLADPLTSKGDLNDSSNDSSCAGGDPHMVSAAKNHEDDDDEDEDDEVWLAFVTQLEADY